MPAQLGIVWVLIVLLLSWQTVVKCEEGVESEDAVEDKRGDGYSNFQIASHAEVRRPRRTRV